MGTEQVLTVVADLLRLGLQFGVPWVKSAQVLRDNNLDPDEYSRVIRDERTFKDFHRTTPVTPTSTPDSTVKDE